MAGIRADIDLSVNTQGVKRSLDRATNEINKVVNRVSGKQINFSVNQKSFTQPLGRINASANEFTKSLEASNARVIAFGASVAILDGISNSFKGLVRETIKFEKTLADINVVLSLSNSQLRQFGEGLFDTARKTAQGFNVASEAALEFSRQGLSTEEVIKRTNDALILTRLTSLKATDAVAGLTAAVNAFGDAGLTTTDIIDKLSAVDVEFAVSSEDLINALQRAGAVAIDAGVEFDSLIGLVAALQQTTARGGAVIGNSLKTIFTRIQRPESLRQLEEMGIAIRDISGAVLPADRILLNLSKTFDKLTQSQQSNAVQFSAGIFQANVFRAALRDLAKENSLQAKATEVSANAAGEAARKNEILNKTISALASQAGTNIQELGAILGDLALGPQLADALEFVNDRVEEIRGALGGGEDEGSTFAKGLVRGIGNVISGPGAIAFGAIFIKLFVNIAKFASSSMKDVLGIVSQKQKLKQMEESIVNVLLQEKNIQQGLHSLEGDRIAQEKFILGILERQANAMREQAKFAQQLAPVLIKAGVTPDLGPPSRSVDYDGDGRKDSFSNQPTASKGLIPEGLKKSERQGATKGGYTAGTIDSMNIAGFGDVVYNKAETVKQFPGMRQPAIMPPENSKAGREYQDTFTGKHGFDPYAHRGFVPNFAKLSGSNLKFGKSKLNLFGGADSIARAVGLNYKKIEAEFKKARPSVMMQASLREIIGSSDKGKMEITGKEHLFDAFSALAGAGVETIERRFGVRPIPPGRQGQGKLSNEQFTERKTKNLLNKEQSQSGHKPTHMLTFDPKTKKGQPNYPTDIIALGDEFPSYEVKSGRFSAANIISKSLRLASDRELSTWMKQHKVSGGKNLDEKNLKKAQTLASKLGLEGSGQGGEFAQMDADEWGMSKGFVPNFKKLYRGTSGYPGSRATNVAGAYWDNPVNLYKDVIKRSMQVTDELQAKAPTAFKNKMTYGVDEYNINDSLFNQLSTGVYKAQNVIKLKKFVDNFDLDDIRRSDGIDEDFYDGAQEERGRAIDSMKKQKGSKKIPGTASNPLPLIQGLRKGVYSFPDLGNNSEYRDSLLKRDEDQIEQLFGWRKTGGRKLKPEFQNNRGFFEDMSCHGGDKSLRGCMFGGKAGLKQSMESNLGFVPNFAAKLNYIELGNKILNYPGDLQRMDYQQLADELSMVPGLGGIKKHTLSNLAGVSPFTMSTRSAFIKQHTTNPRPGSFSNPYTKKEAKERLKQVREKLKSTRQQGYAQQAGINFEDNFRAHFNPSIVKPAGQPHMDFPSGTLSGLDKTQMGEIFLNTHTGGDAYKGIKGHDPELFISKYLRQKLDKGGKNFDFSPNSLGSRLLNFALQKKGGDMSVSNEGGYADILGVNLNGRDKSNKNVSARESLNSIFKYSKKLKEAIGDRGRIYRPGQKYINFQYEQDFVQALSSGLIPNFAGIVPFNNTTPFKKKTIKSKNLMHQEYLKQFAGPPHHDRRETEFKPGQSMLKFLSQFYDRKTLKDLERYPEDYMIKSGGFVPNFASPLQDAIEREKAAGIPASNIRVEQSNQLRSPGNPMGLAVTNTRDEPAGVGQGIRRAKSMGLDPRKHGASKGLVPNFAGGEEGMGLQKLFFFQTALSMGTGLVQQFGQETGEAGKKLNILTDTVSSVISTMMLISTFAGGKGSVGLGGLIRGGAARDSATRSIRAGAGRAGQGAVMKGLGMVGKGLLRFVPVIGAITTGFMVLDGVMKIFNDGKGIMSLFHSNTDRAADKLKKLGESAEKTQSALDAANNLSATRDKISKLEIIETSRTLKQEKELISLQIKEIKQRTSLQSKLAQVDTANLKNKKLINEVNKVKSGEVKGTEVLVSVLEKVAKREAVQVAFATAIKDFGKKTEDEFGMFEGDAPSDDLQKQLNFLANKIAEITVSLDPERKEAMKKNLAAGNIQGISGLESLDLETAEKKKFFINALNEQIKVSEREREDTKKAQQAKAGLLSEYTKIVANYKRQREEIIHQNKLDNIISTSKRKINSSLIDLQSEYEMISHSTAIQNKAALDGAAITEKLESDKLKANQGALSSLEAIRKKYVNITALSSRFNSDAKDAQAGVAELKNAIQKGLNPQMIAEVSDSLGGLDKGQIQDLNTFFKELGKEVKDHTDNQEIINKLTAKYGDNQNSILAMSVLLAKHHMKLTTMGAEQIEVVKKTSDSLRRSQQTAETTAKVARAGLESEKALNLIKQKTVEGARELAMIFAEQKNPAESMVKNLQGEVDTLAVINHFRKDSLKKIMESGALDDKAYEAQINKNRTDAEAALLSLKQLQVQENILRDTEEFKIIQRAKMQTEVISAGAAAKDAAFRNEYLSYNITREALIGSQIKEETSTLETTARNNLTKLKLLAGSEELKKQADLQIQEEITSAQSSALINAEKALVLSAMGKQGELLRKANELQESSNKLIGLENAIRKAAVSEQELRLSVGADIATEGFTAIRGTREAAMRATITGSPEDALAFSQSLEETNKQLQKGSRAFDRMRTKIAEMDVAAKNLGADLVDIGLDQTRSGMKQLFKDIGSGAKSAKEAWSDFGLGLADVLLDRMMEHNIDQIIKNLTFAFTGENALSEAEKMASSNNDLISENQKLVSSLDALRMSVEDQQRIVGEQAASRANVGVTKTGVNPNDVSLSDPNTKRAAEIQSAATEEQAVKLGKEAAERTAAMVKAAKDRQAAEDANNQVNRQNQEVPDVPTTYHGYQNTQEPAIAQIQAKMNNTPQYESNVRDFGYENIDKAATGMSRSLNSVVGTVEQFGQKLTYALEAIPVVPSGPRHGYMPEHFFGGKIQKFAKGGFVEGEPGVDKVPAMLTAGEFVVPKKAAKALKDGGMLQHFEEGGTAQRVKAGASGLVQAFAMQEASRYVAKKMQNKDLDKEKPPEFDMNKFKNLNLDSALSISRGDPRSSGKLLAKDPVMEEYRGHLLDVASYRVAQKNRKVSERMSRIGSIVGTVASFAVSQALEVAKGPINSLIEKGKNVALGHSGLGKHSEAFKAARKAGLHDVNYKDVAKSIESGKALSIKGSSWMNVPNPDGTEGWSKLSETPKYPHYKTEEINYTGIDRGQRDILTGKPLEVFSGGEIPAMLTAGESFIPAPIAKRIGYDNLNKMNRTGSIPIIDGPGGVDNVGPVGLSEGDFIIRRSSTDKLLRDNPNMMRFAMQNPDGFRKAEKGYYKGGIVGTASSPSSSISTPQTTSEAKPAPVVENRISSLLEGTQANQTETAATNQNTEVTNNINVNVTIDKSGNEKVSTEGTQGTYEQEQQLAMKIKTKVLEVIREEKRIGGELSG
jgi:TP901 family phage tail tape measure protein